MITAPGIYQLTADQYHMDPAPEPSLSSSIAKILIEQSPAHAWMAHPRLNLQYEREINSRFDLGSAAHTMLLEKHRGDRIVVVDAKDWRTNAAKDAREAAMAQGKFAVLIEQYKDVCSMVAAARQFMGSTELAGLFEEGLADGLAEQTVIWQEGKLWMRCRPDLFARAQWGNVVVDYKTTENAAPEVFAKQIGRMGYDLQAEFYTRGIKAIDEKEPTFVFLAQEVTKPYACSLIGLSAAYRSVGQAKVNRAISLWDRAVANHNWHGYPTQIAYAEPTPWQLADSEAMGLETNL
jgi:PDDEXK-like uncharacterized protein DUF3799